MGSKPKRRSRLVVDTKLQGSIILALAWPVALCLALNIFMLGVVFTEMTGDVVRRTPELEWLVPLLVTMLGCLTIASAFFLFNSLSISHRMVGPTIRMRQSLRAVQEGNLGLRIKLRKGDYLADVAADLNEFLEWAEPQLRAAAVTDPASLEASCEPAEAAEMASPSSPSSSPEPARIGSPDPGSP